MNYLYILIILFLTIYYFYKMHQSLLHQVKLRKQLDNLITMKTNLSIALENLKAKDEENKAEIKNLNYTLSQRLKELSQGLIDKNNLESKIREMEIAHSVQIKHAVEEARKDSVKRSRSVLRGQATEHLAPFILQDTNPKDYRFLGNPIDYICFEGLSSVLDGTSNTISSVHFIDIKTGKSTLNKSQRRIRDAIKDSRVKFSVVNLDKEIGKHNDKVKEKLETSSFGESEN